MRIVGIDTGLAETGYGIIDADGGVCRIVETGVIATDAGSPLADRLGRIYARISEVLAEFQVERAAVEALYSKYRHPRTNPARMHEGLPAAVVRALAEAEGEER